MTDFLVSRHTIHNTIGGNAMFFHNNDLGGMAYDSAIENIIAHVNKLGFAWDYFNNWRDAHQLADNMNIRFDCNGEIA